MLIFLASSCAACSKASLILSKPHSVAFTFFLTVFPNHHLSGRWSLSSSFFPCNPCHGSISLAPSILWLAIPAATDPVFLLAFLLRPALETFLLCFLSWTKYSHIYGSFTIILQILPRYASFSHNPFPLHMSKLVVYDSSSSLITTEAKLPVAEGLLAALLVTTKHNLLRNTDRSWYKKSSLPLLPAPHSLHLGQYYPINGKICSFQL